MWYKGNMKHTCIKPQCSNTYEDKDPDPYYCPSCVEEKKEIAKQVDAKFAGKSKKKRLSFNERMSQYQTIGGITMINLPR